MKIVLIGIQGAGKSTQGNLLAKALSVPYLSTGHIFRDIAKEHTSLGRQIKVVMTAGYLISDAKTLSIVNDYLSRPEYEKGYILDGFPRTLGQAKAFKQDISQVFYLTIDDKEALWRISGREEEGREDETLKAIRKRIKLFHEFTEPVINYYKEKNKLTEIVGDKSVEEIHREIMHHLKNHHGK